MLQDEKVLGSLRDSIGLLKGLDYGLAVENAGDESFIEISRNLMGGHEVPWMVTSQPLRQMIIRSGELLVDAGGFTRGKF